MRLLKSILFIQRLTVAFGSLDAARLYLARARSKLRVSKNNEDVSEIKLAAFSIAIHMRFATSDWSVLEQIFISKEYEDPTAVHAEAVSRCYERILDGGSTPIIIDCGANIGLAALWYARKYPKATIFSIEPEVENFRILQRNVSAFPNIIPIHAAVAGSEGKVALSNDTGSPWAWTTVRSEAGEMSSVTINEILLRCDRGRGFIIKVDIEGFEVDLFSQNTEWIAEFPVVVAETHDYLFPWRGTANSIFSALISRGLYDFVQKGENCFCYAHASLKQQVTPRNDEAAPESGLATSAEQRVEPGGA